MSRIVLGSALVTLGLALGSVPVARAQDGGMDGSKPGTEGTTPAPAPAPAPGTQGKPGGDQAPGGNQGGRGQGGQGGRGNRGNRGNRGGGNFVDQIKGPVALTDDEVTKAKAIEDAARAETQKARDDNSGNNDRQARRAKTQATTDKMRADIRALLDKDQQSKFDDVVKDLDAQRAQRGQRGQRGQGGQGGMGGQGGQGRGRGGDPEARAKRLYDEAEKELALGDTEKGAVMTLVKKLLDARTALRTDTDKGKDDLLSFMKGKGTSESEMSAIGSKLKEFHGTLAADQTRVADAEKALREVLSIAQEAKLCSIDVLD